MLHHSSVFPLFCFLFHPPHLTLFPSITESPNHLRKPYLYTSLCPFPFPLLLLPNLKIFVPPPKHTVFKQKIETSDIHTYFPDYTGRPGDVQAGCEYFSHRFQALNQNSQKQVYVHLTCATGELLDFLSLSSLKYLAR